MYISMKHLVVRMLLVLIISSGLCGYAAASEDDPATGSNSVPAASINSTASDEQKDANRIIREGVVVDFSVSPSGEGVDKVVANGSADVTFRITDAGTGKPIKGRYPAAWMDLGAAWQAKGDRVMSCRERVSTYLQGIVGVRPMINLNSHFLMVMNRDASISVIDPAVGITGITNLFTQVNLNRPGADWAKTEDQKRLFVTMPLANEVALVDTDAFKVIANLKAGEQPTRAEMQGDGRYLWVGNNARKVEESGVTVIDTASFTQVAFIQTGKGHHEITFSDDGRYTFVSNRDDGTVSVIDVKTLQKVKDLKTGPVPISLAFSALGKALYVADGKDGTVTVVDPASLVIRTRIQAKPGLGPLRFSNDGRWGLVVNPIENSVVVIDAATDKLMHTLAVGKQPYQVNFTRLYGYIRSLGTEQVGLIPLSDLDKPELPIITYFTAGQGAPGRGAEISIADSIIPSIKEAAAYVVNQAEGTVSYYMEGMTAPMGSFRNYGHDARAIEIVDRSLGEIEPGVYTGRVKLPIEGTYDVAFMMDSPGFLHCFTTVVEPDPEAKKDLGKLDVEYQVTERRVPVGKSTKVKFKLFDPDSGASIANIPDVKVLYFAASGGGRNELPAKSLGNGMYEADIMLSRVTTYYLYVGSRSEKLKYTDLPYLSLMGMPAPVAKAVSGEKP